MKPRGVPTLAILLALFSPAVAFSQRTPYPAELRGYKVERVAGDTLKTAPGSNELIRFGKVRVARITRSGVNVELPIVVSPVKQKGQVDFLVFEDIVVNGTPIRIDEYHRQFDLPNRKEDSKRTTEILCEFAKRDAGDNWGMGEFARKVAGYRSHLRFWSLQKVLV